MSIHRNRSEVKTVSDRRTYNLKTTIDPDPYKDEHWNVHRTATNSFARKWKKKVIYRFQFRAYRNWKHNRKTQWKNKLRK